MRTDVNILLLEAGERRGGKRAEQIRELGYNVKQLTGVPDENHIKSDDDLTVVMVHAGLLRGTGVERLRKVMEKNPDMAVIYMVDENSRIGSLNDAIDGIYDYLALPASPSYMKHVIDLAVDRRARFLLEKYYQSYLENQVNEQLQSIANQQIRLMHADRLSSIGQVAAGIIHELNNPLTYMKLNLETVKTLQSENSRVLMEYGREHPEYRYKHMSPQELASEISDLLDTVKKGVNHIEKILGSIRRFSRRPEEVQTEFDLLQVVSNALNFAKVSMKNNIKIKQEFDDALPPLVGDPQKLEQVILNLIINASHALEETKNAGISIKAAKVEANGRNSAQISVSDNGPGIPVEIIGRIFDPFFTTKPKDKGTGLGLSISKEIVAEFSGTLEVESEKGLGAVFILTIPLKKGR
ncbi:MAG: hypothetical protein IEMM0002_0821 [bacterium]|nr:MAG: hypothetical protein IEMM0002_0821 [bacterium]